MEKHPKDTDTWIEAPFPATFVEFMSKCDRFLVLGVGAHGEDGESEEMVGLFKYGLKKSDFADLMLAYTEFVKMEVHNAVSRLHTSFRVVEGLNQRMLETHAKITNSMEINAADIENVADNPDMDNVGDLCEGLVGLLGEAMGSLQALNLLTYDPDDPFAGFALKEKADVEAIAADLGAGADDGTPAGDAVDGSGEQVAGGDTPD